MTWIQFIYGLELPLRAPLMWFLICIALCDLRYWANSVFVILMIVSRSLLRDILVEAVESMETAGDGPAYMEATLVRRRL